LTASAATRHHLRHRSASGGYLDNLWELSFEDGQVVVLASIRPAAGPLVHVALRLAHSSRRRTEHLGDQADIKGRREFAITRIDETTWAVEHGVYDAAYPEPKLPALALVLTHAPAAEAHALAQLATPEPR
jgi:hypothetical protein